MVKKREESLTEEEAVKNESNSKSVNKKKKKDKDGNSSQDIGSDKKENNTNTKQETKLENQENVDVNVDMNSLISDVTKVWTELFSNFKHGADSDQSQRKKSKKQKEENDDSNSAGHEDCNGEDLALDSTSLNHDDVKMKKRKSSKLKDKDIEMNDKTAHCVENSEKKSKKKSNAPAPEKLFVSRHCDSISVEGIEEVRDNNAISTQGQEDECNSEKIKEKKKKKKERKKEKKLKEETRVDILVDSRELENDSNNPKEGKKKSRKGKSIEGNDCVEAADKEESCNSVQDLSLSDVAEVTSSCDVVESYQSKQEKKKSKKSKKNCQENLDSKLVNNKELDLNSSIDVNVKKKKSKKSKQETEGESRDEKNIKSKKRENISGDEASTFCSEIKLCMKGNKKKHKGELNASFAGESSDSVRHDSNSIEGDDGVQIKQKSKRKKSKGTKSGSEKVVTDNSVLNHENNEIYTGVESDRLSDNKKRKKDELLGGECNQNDESDICDPANRKKRKRNKNTGEEEDYSSTIPTQAMNNSEKPNNKNDNAKEAGRIVKQVDSIKLKNEETTNSKDNEKKKRKSKGEGENNLESSQNKDNAVDEPQSKENRNESYGEVEDGSSKTIATEATYNSEKLKKKKKKKDKNKSKEDNETDKLVDSTESKSEKTPRPNESEKKNRKRKSEEENNYKNEKSLKRKQKNEDTILSVSDLSSFNCDENEDNEVGERKSKKNRVENKNVGEEGDIIANQATCDSQKSKKKKDKNKSKEENGTESESENTSLVEGKKKKRKSEGEEENEKPVKKKKKSEDNAIDTSTSYSPFISPVFESEERQEKFKRLLGGKKNKEITSDVMNTEKNSGNKNNGTEILENKQNTSSPVLAVGQWNGVMFESAERQNKFLRLLGGAKSSGEKKKGLFSSGKASPKKGLFGSLSSLVNANSNRAGNVGGGKAMDVEAATSLNQSLEEDYNKALSRRLKREGTSGIGFVKDPAEGKKFHINTNAVKSTKFSDDDE